jgi:hypothetical protein
VGRIVVGFLGCVQSTKLSVSYFIDWDLSVKLHQSFRLRKILNCSLQLMIIQVQLGDVKGKIVLFNYQSLSSLDIQDALSFTADQHIYLTCTGLRNTRTKDIIPMGLDTIVPGTTVVPESEMKNITSEDTFEVITQGLF